MQLLNILNLPAKYRSRYDKVKKVIISDFKIEITDEHRVFTATTSSVNSTNTYTTVIGFKLGEAIRPQSEVLVHCDCKSFEFKVSNMIGKDHSLLILKEMKPLKSSNTYNILMGCKHLIRLAQYIFERKHVFDK